MNALPDPTPGRLLVLIAPHAASQAMLVFAARLAHHGVLRVLDGGNRFNAYIVARHLRRLAQGGLHQALERIQVARAFTCYQMLALLEQSSPAAAYAAQPLLAIDFLSTFYDESVPLYERRRLLEHSLAQLQRLSQPAAVVVSVRPPAPAQVDPTGLLSAVQEAADLVWLPDQPPTLPPPRLF